MDGVPPPLRETPSDLLSSRFSPESAGVSHLLQVLLAESGRGVVEVQDGGGGLDDVPAALDAAEAVVPAQTEIMAAAAAAAELEHLTGNNGVLLGHAGGRGGGSEGGGMFRKCK